MAGPLTIQRVPRGLLHALSMKGSGALPQELAAEVRAIFDASALYLGDTLRSTTSGATVTGDGAFTASSGAIPAGEIWLVNNFTIQFSNVGAGTNLTAQPFWKRFNTNGLFVVASPVVIPVNGDGVIGQQFDFASMIWYPGDTYGVLATNGTYGLNPAATICVDYYRLEI